MPDVVVPCHAQGDFSRITDIARMTFECNSCSIMRMALQALADSPDWTLHPVVNRLMPEYDADMNGGYRDMLCAPPPPSPQSPTTSITSVISSVTTSTPSTPPTIPATAVSTAFITPLTSPASTS